MTTLAHFDGLHSLSDRELVAEIHQLAARERHSTARVIAALMELDARKLYLGEGCSSLFTYCTQVLHLSEHAAYGRIEAARVTRRFPAILDQLADGSLTLTAVGLLASHLTPENYADVLAGARHKSKREVERIVAALRPLPAVPSMVRKLPAARPVEAATVPPVYSSRPAATPTAAAIPEAKPVSDAPSLPSAVPHPPYRAAPRTERPVVSPIVAATAIKRVSLRRLMAHSFAFVMRR